MSEGVHPDLVEFVNRLVSEETRFPVLACALRARSLELPLDAALIALVSEALGRELAAVTEVFALVQGASDGGALRACRGISCRSVGADGLGEELLDPAGLAVEEVLCLNNCDRGPSLEHEGRLYCGTDDIAIIEERSWRS